MAVHLKPISIVVPTANRRELLKDCLSSLVGQDFPNELYEIFVVDNGDGEGATIVDAMSSDVDTKMTHIQCEKHDANTARNLGIQSAFAEIVCLVDDDVVAPPWWLRNFAEGIERHPDVGCFAAGVRPVFEGNPPRSCGCSLPASTLDRGPDEQEIFQVWGCNMALRKSAFDLAGPFREGMAMEQETEWLLRYRATGGRTLWIPDAWLWHRRVDSDLRTLKLLRQHFRRGILLVELGVDVSGRAVARDLVRSLLHASLKMCANGLIRAARHLGMAVALAKRRRGTQSSPSARASDRNV